MDLQSRCSPSRVARLPYLDSKDSGLCVCVCVCGVSSILGVGSAFENQVWHVGLGRERGRGWG